MARKISVKIGDKNNNLEIIAIERRKKYGSTRPFLTCRCSCGAIRKDVRPFDFKSGGVKSCGCSRLTANGVSTTAEYYMYHSAKERAKKKGLPFDIEVSDIIIPAFCPLLCIPLKRANKVADDNSPTLDRLLPHLGYVKGNVLVISNKANRIKSNASVDDLMMVAENLHQIFINLT